MTKSGGAAAVAGEGEGGVGGEDVGDDELQNLFAKIALRIAQPFLMHYLDAL